jgi:hypothetical protein
LHVVVASGTGNFDGILFGAHGRSDHKLLFGGRVAERPGLAVKGETDGRILELRRGIVVGTATQAALKDSPKDPHARESGSKGDEG